MNSDYDLAISHMTQAVEHLGMVIASEDAVAVSDKLIAAECREQLRSLVGLMMRDNG